MKGGIVMNRFVIGDVHGKLDMLERLLMEWNPDNEKLILLGDLIDRGPDSYGVVTLARKLKEVYGAEIVGGNHDQMFIDWLNLPESFYYYSQGGAVTIDSFFKEPTAYVYRPEHIAKRMLEMFPKEIAFLSELKDYAEWRDYVFVHAGVELTYLDWRETSAVDFRWMRGDFHYENNHTGKTFIFGHTPTRFLNPDGSADVWLSPCKTKIGIDGGAVFGGRGRLHGLKIDEDNLLNVHSVSSELEVETKHLLFN